MTVTPVPARAPDNNTHAVIRAEAEAKSEVGSSAVAALARAEVEARTIAAWRRPRDLDTVRVDLMKECKRGGFAKIARYKIPVKGEGWTIRFAEAAMRCMKNVFSQVATVYDDEEKRIVRVTVMDLEGNASYSKDITVTKTVERSSLKPGQVAISQRLNSVGNMTFLVAATDDDLMAKEGALVSKAIRTQFLRLLPGDLADDALAQIKETMRAGFDANPDAERKMHADAFAGLGVSPAELKEYLGHDLTHVTADEAEDLRGLYNAIKGGETTWKAAFEARTGKTEAAPAVATTTKGVAGLKAKVTKSKVEAPKAPPPPADDENDLDTYAAEHGAK